MTATYAGAVAALRSAFTAAFTAAPVQYQNEDPPSQPWPPSAPAAPWVYFEVLQTQSVLRGVGLPGNQTWLTTGHINVHVFAPVGYGMAAHLALAEAAGAIFKAATFYTSEPGSRVTCFGVSIRGADSEADDGNWFGVTASIPFEFFFIG